MWHRRCHARVTWPYDRVVDRREVMPASVTVERGGSGLLLERLSGTTCYHSLQSWCSGSLTRAYFTPYDGQLGMSLFDVLWVSVWGLVPFRRCSWLHSRGMSVGIPRHICPGDCLCLSVPLVCSWWWCGAWHGRRHPSSWLGGRWVQTRLRCMGESRDPWPCLCPCCGCVVWSSFSLEPARPTWSIPQRLVPSSGVSFLVLCLVGLRWWCPPGVSVFWWHSSCVPKVGDFGIVGTGQCVSAFCTHWTWVTHPSFWWSGWLELDYDYDVKGMMWRGRY